MALAALLAGLSAAAQGAPACTLSIVYSNQPSLPYLAASAPDAPLPGLAVDIVRAALAANGCSASFARRPGKRVLAEMGAGMHAAALMLSYSPERGRAMVFPLASGELDARRRLARMTYYLYRPASSSIGWDGAVLFDVHGPVGINAGFSVGADLRPLGVRVEEASTTRQNLEKLQMGRLAAYAMHSDAVDPLLAAGLVRGIEKLPVPLSTRDYYLAFSTGFYKNNPALAEQIWDSVAALREKLQQERGAAYGKAQ